MVKILQSAAILLLCLGISGLNAQSTNDSTYPEFAFSKTFGIDFSLASSTQQGMNPNHENSKTWKSYGSYISIFFLGLVPFFLIIRGREIRRQHPRIVR